MTPQPAYWAVIPAAGTGARMAADLPKQYLKLGHRCVLEHTLELFCNHEKIQGIIVVLAEQDRIWETLDIARNNKIQTTTGGAERYHSVYNGLQSLATVAHQNDWVMVHDAARPCLLPSDIDHLIEEVSGHSSGGILATPAKDTMKRVGQHNEIVETIDRRGLWHALTPQMFRLNVLESALEKVIANKISVTDEAQAVELTGARPVLVEGRPDNIKITHPDDLVLARFILQQQGRDL
ncbi:MAG: 2-C-methyl-D-erythritol 4-phosphate cytidylyltransferase [Gammaproteobacteria bacterium]